MANTDKTPAAVSADITGLDSGNPALTLTFGDGVTLTLRADMVTTSIATHAMMHGFKQKLVDAAAISRNPETGRPATIADKRAAVQEVFDRLTAPDPSWNKGRGDGAGNAGGLLLTALVRLYDGVQTPEKVKAWLEGQDDAAKAQLRKNPRVAAMIQTIRDERAKPGDVDTDAMLAEGLGALPGDTDD